MKNDKRSMTNGKCSSSLPYKVLDASPARA